MIAAGMNKQANFTTERIPFMGKLFFCFCLGIGCLVTVAGWAAEKVVATRLTGERVEGELLSITAKDVKIKEADKEVTLSAEQISEVEVRGGVKPARPRVWTTLTDRTLLVSGELQVSGAQASTTLLSGASVIVPAKSLSVVRLRAQDAEVAEQWRQIVEGERSGDVLVVRKTVAKEAEDDEEDEKEAALPAITLDVLEGRILQMDGEQVQFDFDDEKITVKREKLEGMLFGQGKRLEERPTCWLYDAAGSQLAVKSITLQAGAAGGGNSLAVVTLSGAQCTLPLSAVRRIDFSAGNLLELGSDDLPLEVTTKEYDLQPKGLAPLYEKLLAPQRFESAAAGDWKVQGREFKSGVVILQAGRISTRLPAGFKQFEAKLALADCSDAHASATVKILLDGKEVAKQTLSMQRKEQSLPVSVLVGEAKRLLVEVEFPKGSVAGAVVVLGEAKVTK